MLFNSIDFAIFLPVVFMIYWMLNGKLRIQNIFLIAASYLFYGWWDWRFLFLIVFSSLLDYSIGRRLNQEHRRHHRKLLLWTSILVNLGFLGFFKYYNFFVDNFVASFSYFGIEFRPETLNIILPVGISFYTFQTLSYTIDVYRDKLKATNDPIAFSAYVCFFPQLVAGPIERAVNLLPQFNIPRKFDTKLASDGMRQILWGLFKKVVVADNCAIVVNQIFADHASLSATDLVVGSIFFAFQIYGDFSGYSDIAIGTSRLFGFELRQNFAFPYFSRDIAEFWRRWHISLSTWFRDYLYIPLGGSRVGVWKRILNTMIIFVISGFWHGANWTFIFWGALNAIFFMPLLLLQRNRNNMDTVALGRYLPGFKEFFQMLGTFALTCLAWIFFRSNTIQEAFEYIGGIMDTSITSMPTVSMVPFLFIGMLIGIEWLQRSKLHGLEIDGISHRWLRWLIYLSICLSIVIFGAKAQTFIYFQF